MGSVMTSIGDQVENSSVWWDVAPIVKAMNVMTNIPSQMDATNGATRFIYFCMRFIQWDFVLIICVWVYCDVILM